MMEHPPAWMSRIVERLRKSDVMEAVRAGGAFCKFGICPGDLFRWFLLKEKARIRKDLEA